MSKYLGSVLCSYHRDSAPSMAIYENEGTSGGFWCGSKEYVVERKDFSFYCFSCHAHGFLTELEVEELLEAKGARTEYNGYHEFSLDLPNKEAKEFLKSRQVEEYWALDYGVMQRGYELYLPCYDYKRQPIGYQLRSLDEDAKPKIYSRPGENGKYPTHSWVYGYSGDNEYNKLCLVESILDGLSIWSRYSTPSVAVLGTNPHPEFYKSLVDNVSREMELVIIFDGDAAGESSGKFLLDKLKILGYNVGVLKIEGRVWELPIHI